jgi:DNA-binding FadR family transcriptional regulator
MVKQSSPFGGQARTRALLALRLLDESHPRELSRVLGASLNGIQQALRGLERDGLVSARTMGRTRVFRLNPAYFAQKELARYLLRLTEAESDLRDEVARLRRRPRATGKPL